jgi:anti-sigma factor RsiW
MPSFVCRLIRRRLGAFQDGELGAVARAKTTAHLARCPGCAAELAGLGRLRAALTAAPPEPPEAVWDAFWPQVRARMAAAPTEARPTLRAAWPPLFGAGRFAFGSALAAVALAVIAVVAPWQPEPIRPESPAIALAPTPAAVVVQSVETADPQSSVMVYTNPESDVTVVWVFGLEATDI